MMQKKNLLNANKGSYKGANKFYTQIIEAFISEKIVIDKIEFVQQTLIQVSE